jgi:hypothetical protein
VKYKRIIASTSRIFHCSFKCQLTINLQWCNESCWCYGLVYCIVKYVVQYTFFSALRRSSRISRKERIRNVTIRQQTGLEETIIKEIKQNQLTCYSQVQRMAEGRLPKIALKWMPKQKRARERPKKNRMKSIRESMNERNLNEALGEDRKQ